MTALYLAFALCVALAAAMESRITAPGCGQTPARSLASHRIVGGIEADPYSWPFICSLQYSGSHICGGSLVKSLDGTFYFVTAAHCLDRQARYYSISCAVHDRFGSNPHQQVFDISSYVNHEGYNANTFANDISVMALKSQPTETNQLQPVCVADSDYYGGETAYVIGWGTLSEGGSAARRLMEVSKPILTDSQCRSAYGSSYDSSVMVCSGILGVGGKDACQGDSGGPMVSYRNGGWHLVGVVSWGYGCARPEYPGVYADVFSLRNWLNGKIN